MPRLRLIRLALVVAAAVAASATPVVAGQRRPNADGELVVASLAGETGAYSALLDSLRVPVQLAVDEINAAGGIDGTPVRLVSGDDGGEPDVAVESFDRVVGTEKADVVIGPASSATTLAVVARLRDTPALTCSGSATIDEISKVPSGGYFFRTAPPDRLQARALADLLVADGHSRIAVLARDDAYGHDFLRWLEKGLRAEGTKAVAIERYDPAGRRFARAVGAVRRAKPDAVVVVDLAEDSAPMLQALVAGGLGPKDVPLYGVDAMQSGQLAASVDPTDPSVLEGLQGTSPATAPAGVAHPFHDRLAQAGVDPVFSAHYYDCTILAALAALQAGSDDATRLRRTFRSSLTGDADCSTFADCKALLEAGRTIHWRGASSAFDGFGRFEPTEGVFDVWSYDATGGVVVGGPERQIVVAA